MTMMGKAVRMAAAAADTSASWAQLYNAICSKLGVSPQNFQLITPFTTWNWSVEPNGQTAAEQQSFLDAMPAWSPVGAYASGSSFSDAYQTWLNTLVVQAAPALQNQITQQQSILQSAVNKYTSDFKTAQAAYQADPTVLNNSPTFVVWLQSGLGLGYGATLQTDGANVQSQQAQLNAFIAQANDPVIAAANKALANPAYTTQVVNTSLMNPVSEPGYAQITDYATWVTQNAGQGSASINWSTAEASSTFTNSFAQAQATFDYWFFSIYVNGSWQRSTELENSASLNVSITFNPWGRLAITPLPWYSEATVKAKASNPSAYRQGYTPTRPANGQGGWVFGQGGIMPLRATDMLVAYQPSFSVTAGSNFSSALQEQLKVATGIQIGPFTFGGEYGQSTNTWSASSTASSFTGKSTSQFPVIFGVMLEIFGQSGS